MWLLTRKHVANRIGIACSGLILLLAVSACGSDSNSTPADATAPQGGFGTYFYGENGALLIYQITAPAEHPLVLQVEEHRTNVGAAPLTYILVSADNRNGSKSQEAHRLRVVTVQGSTVSFLGVWEVMEAWTTGSRSSDLSTEAINQGRQLHDDMMNLSVGLPGTVSQHLLASNESLDSVGTVFRLPSTQEVTQGKTEIELKR